MRQGEWMGFPDVSYAGSRGDLSHSKKSHSRFQQAAREQKASDFFRLTRSVKRIAEANEAGERWRSHN
jgi:hypothetical protein